MIHPTYMHPGTHACLKNIGESMRYLSECKIACAELFGNRFDFLATMAGRSAVENLNVNLHSLTLNNEYWESRMRVRS